MYEARQNKEKVSRIISLMKDKRVRPKNGIIKDNTIRLHSKINRPSIQKMVVYDGENPPVDMNVIATLPNIEASCQNPVFNNKENYSYSGYEKIGILAHGSPTSIDWNKQSFNGEQFVEQELKKNGIKSGTTLEIWSCFAGSEGNDGVEPLVDTIRNKLAENKINIAIKGVIDAHVVLNDKNEHYGLKKKKEYDFIELRNRLLVETGFFPERFPKKNYDDAISDLKTLWSFEKESDEAYKPYIEGKKMQWLEMCKKMREDSNRENIIGNPISNIWRELHALSDVSEIFEVQ